MTKTDNIGGARHRPHVVAVVYDGLCSFEYGIVTEVFGLPRPELGGDLYHFSSVALEDQPIRAAGGLMINASGTLEDFDNADTIVIPGWRGKDELVPAGISQKIRSAHARGARILSICSGIYVLASAGLLQGRCVTTHWRYVDDLKSRFPEVLVEANQLYVDEGDIITSAGSSAGIDACLHVLRKDYGAKVANSVARRLVMHPHRQGGQAQFIEQPFPKNDSSGRLSQFMNSIRTNLARPHNITSLAKLAGMSSRTFQRRFFALTGMPAIQWLIHERISQACLLLETTDLSTDSISYSVGFRNTETMRYHFRQILSVTPLQHRKRFTELTRTKA